MKVKQDESIINGEKDHHRILSRFDLLYTSEMHNIVYLGKATTLIYGGLCLISAPFILLYPFETEFVSFFSSLPVRFALSSAVVGIGLLLPRWFALATNDHVINMYYCKKTKAVQLETVTTFCRTIKYETNIDNLQQIDKGNAFGCNNIICKDTQRQFYVDTAYLDDDVLELMGFINEEQPKDKENLDGV